MLIDEVLAVGDEAFQRKCLDRIAERIAAGTTLVLVSHAPGAIELVCDRVAVLDRGKLVFDGPAPDGLLHYHRMLGTESGGRETRRTGHVERPLAVVDVELLDGDGRRRQVFHADDPLRLVFDVVSHRTTERPQLVLEVRDQRGTPVFTTARPLTLADGGARVVLDIERLALLGGDYDIVVSAHEEGDPDPGIDRLIAFSVAHEPEATGIADLRGNWTVSERERVVS
jgi:ABC-2 type transport system ATP-binding protein